MRSLQHCIDYSNVLLELHKLISGMRSAMLSIKLAKTKVIDLGENIFVLAFFCYTVSLLWPLNCCHLPTIKIELQQKYHAVHLIWIHKLVQ